MRDADKARSMLRSSTATEHERVDAAFGNYLLADRAHYIAFLKAQAEAFLPVEAAIDDAQPERMLPDWPSRRRAPLLKRDLAALDVTLEPLAEFPVPTSPEALLGAIYVLEGSRLGGKFLERQIADGLPREFMSAHDSASWRELVGIIDERLQSTEQIEAAIASARSVFALFETGALRHSRGLANV